MWTVHDKYLSQNCKRTRVSVKGQGHDPEKSLRREKSYVACALTFRSKVSSALQCYLASESEDDAETLMGAVDFMPVPSAT